MCALVALVALQVRAELPAPRAGQLPLPSSLPPALQQQLSGPLPGWQQLPWPQGHTQQQPAHNSKAALHFKVGVEALSTPVVMSVGVCVCPARALRSRGASHLHGIESYPCKITCAPLPASGGGAPWWYSCWGALRAHAPAPLLPPQSQSPGNSACTSACAQPGAASVKACMPANQHMRVVLYQ